MKKKVYSVLHAARRIYWRVAKPKTFGVKVAIYSADRSNILLVQHRYGAEMLMLPGGGVGRGETPHQAAQREVTEELAIELHDLTFLHDFVSSGEGKRDTIHFFSATATQQPTPDPAEIATAEYYPLDRLPANTSPATRRRLDEIQSNTFSPAW
ncbi:NUDIX domain-containing protein [Sphingomonas sp. S2-65]|uniref:NUDIX domain-containing protein n=1 Tax=Sphingomonas sp. S2-65 TaxID=2903960 RepID=UPI001F17DE21|nr:NUDIX domain-containing protein [Sphingomonas sp. S2-65]UYY58826.1 NUDIX domain-containing protein [Sphingomonas sp. S2-65]